jgi:nicotinate phosphoribosyltransferase
LVTVEGDSQDGAALLVPVMHAGRRVAPAATLDDLRRHAASELARLPPALARLEDAPAYPVEIAPALVRLAAEVDRATAATATTKGPLA